MNIAKTLVKLSWLLLLAACAKSNAPIAGGSESHFLDACTESSQCGVELSCHANVCTRECESASQCEGLGEAAICVEASGLCGALEPDVIAEPVLLGTSEALGEPAQMAFIEGRPGAERVMLLGQSGAVKQVSEWQAPADWSTELCISGADVPRFVDMTFDGTGDYLAFVERESCDYSGNERVVVHDLVTGQSWVLGTFTSVRLYLGPESTLLATSYDDESSELYELDPAALKVTHRDWPSDAQSFAGGSIATFGDAEVLILWSIALRSGDDGLQVLEPFEQLGESWDVQELRASPSGHYLCAIAVNMTDPRQGMAMLASPQRISMQPIELPMYGCTFSADDRYIVYDGVPFEVVDDELVPLPVPSERMKLDGAHGDSLIGTTRLGEVIRFDPAAGTTQVLIGGDVLEDACGPEPRFDPYTQLHIAQDGRDVVVVQHTCRSFAPDESASLALDLATGDWLVIEVATVSEQPLPYDVAWPGDDTAWLFSARSNDSAGFYEITPGPEITLRTFDELEGILHSPAVPR